MMPTPALDTHGNTHRLWWLLPDSAAACLATPDCCAITKKKPKISSLRRGLATPAQGARHARRPTLTGPARDAPLNPQVGTWGNRGVTTASTGWSPRNTKRSETMSQRNQYVGLDVSLKETSICVIDDADKIVWRGQVESTPEGIASAIKQRATHAVRIGLESGQLSS